MRIHHLFGHGWILAPVLFRVCIALDEVELKEMQNKERGQYLTIIIHCTHYPSSQWLRTYS